jgi:hypothetical protein
MTNCDAQRNFTELARQCLANSDFCRRRLQNRDGQVYIIPIPRATNGACETSSAEVLETSALSYGLSLDMSSEKIVASWLAREMET